MPGVPENAALTSRRTVATGGPARSKSHGTSERRLVQVQREKLPRHRRRILGIRRVPASGKNNER